MSSFRILPGLPAYGAAAVLVPPAWGHGAHEGLVVEFITDTGERWVGNFRPGLGGVDDVLPHPDGRNVLVVSAGSAWLVDPNRRETSEMGDAIDGIWSVSDPEGLVMSRQGLAFLRHGPKAAFGTRGEYRGTVSRACNSHRPRSQDSPTLLGSQNGRRSK